MTTSIVSIAEDVSRQIPAGESLVCVVGLMSSGKTTLVKALAALGRLTFDPASALRDARQMDNPDSGDEMCRYTRGAYNRTQPSTLIVDGLPKTPDQLTALKTLAHMYQHEFIVVHVVASPAVRLARYAAGCDLSERVRRQRILTLEEQSTKSLYNQMAKFVPWRILVSTG